MKRIVLLVVLAGFSSYEAFAKTNTYYKPVVGYKHKITDTIKWKSKFQGHFKSFKDYQYSKFKTNVGFKLADKWSVGPRFELTIPDHGNIDPIAGADGAYMRSLKDNWKFKTRGRITHGFDSEETLYRHIFKFNRNFGSYDLYVADEIYYEVGEKLKKNEIYLGYQRKLFDLVKFDLYVSYESHFGSDDIVEVSTGFWF